MSRGRTRELRTLWVALGSVVVLALLALALSEPLLIDRVRSPSYRLLVWTCLGVSVPFAALAVSLGLTAQRTALGTPGRLRRLALGYGSGVLAGASVLGVGLLWLVGQKLPTGAPITLQDAVWLLPSGYRAGLIALAVVLGLSALVTVVALIGSWFLLPSKTRRYAFIVFDLVLLVACALSTAWFELSPEELTAEALAGASVRLITTLLLGVRLAIRMLPFLLDTIERLDFRSLVAVRHLRAKKSGFLAAISFLSIMAVSVSSCALTTTLSVMGGFRQDLKRKILGNNAHIVIDRADGRLPDYGALTERMRGVEGVRGVSPYLSGEVMISSASNLAGAVLRGIDLDHIGEVSELPSNMRVGSLDYLREPDKLKSLPPGQLGLSGSLPKASRADDEAQVKPGKSARLTEELDKALREPTTPPASRPALDQGRHPSLPGIVVGQELARSLRLYLGDEVNVVTPLGDLGPTGPMPKSRPFRVAGIFYSGMYEYDMKFAYVTLPAAQRFLGADQSASGLEITVREPDRAQDVATRIDAGTRGERLRVRAWQELNKNLFGALALEKLAMFIALGIAILVASFCIVGTLTLMVQEKGREVAVLKAMGAGDRAIVAIFVLEGTLIGVLGSVLGLGLGYAMCFAAEHFGVRLNPEVYYIDKLPVHIDPSEFFTVGIAAIVVSLLVTIYPAQLASRLRPVDALRYE